MQPGKALAGNRCQLGFKNIILIARHTSSGETFVNGLQPTDDLLPGITFLNKPHSVAGVPLPQGTISIGKNGPGDGSRVLRRHHYPTVVLLHVTGPAPDIGVIVSGHTHRPHLFDRNGTTYINPGSASFPRPPSSASIALLHIEKEGKEVHFLDLETGHRSPWP